MDQHIADYEQAARQLMDQLASNACEELALDDLSVPLSDRVVSVQKVDDGVLQAHIRSDGFSLQVKSFLEKGFSTCPPEAGWQWRLRFRRSSAPSQTPKPVRVSRQRPFGMKGEVKPIDDVRQVIAVASGKGGVGKSTVSSQLAITLASQGYRVGLLDGDVYGPSASLMLGLKGRLQVDDDRKLIPASSYGVRCASFGSLTGARQPAMWRGPMVSKAIQQLCYDVAWGALDYLIVDFPPGTGDIQLTMLEKLPFAGAVIVTTPQQVSVLDAHKAVSMFEIAGVPILGVVENMSTFRCSSCGHEEPVFGSAAFRAFCAERSLKTLATIPVNPLLTKACDQGLPVTLLGDEDLLLVWEKLAEATALALSASVGRQ